MTNFEKIKNMSIDEMAIFFTNFDCFKLCKHEGPCKTYVNCKNGLKNILKQRLNNGRIF